MKQLTLDEAAVLLGVSVRQLRYRVDKGQIKATRVGKRYYIDQADLPQSEARKEDKARRERQMQAAVRDAMKALESISGRCSMLAAGAADTTEPEVPVQVPGPNPDPDRAARKPGPAREGTAAEQAK